MKKILEGCQKEEARALNGWLLGSDNHTTLYRLELMQSETCRVSRQLQLLEEAQQADAYDRRYGKGKYAQRSEASAFIEGVDRGLQNDFEKRAQQVVDVDRSIPASTCQHDGFGLSDKYVAMQMPNTPEGKLAASRIGTAEEFKG